MKKIHSYLLILIFATNVYAQNHSEVSASGDMIFYDIHDNYATVVGRCDSVSSANPYIDLVIPPFVTFEGSSVPVRVIGKTAFTCDSILASVVIPYTVKQIDSAAFSECFALGTIYVPSTVDSIGYNAFRNIANVDYHGYASNAKASALWLNGYHDAEGFCYRDSTMQYLCHAPHDLTSLVVPSTVETIGSNAFAGTMISSLIYDVKSLGQASSLFRFCQNLKEVVIRNAPRSYMIADSFRGCKNLQKVVFGDSVFTVYARSFKDCTKITNIVLPEDASWIEGLAFEGCSSLEKVAMTSRTVKIDMGAFARCVNLRQVVWGENLAYIETDAFSDCPNLKHFSFYPSLIEFDKGFGGSTSIEIITSMDTSPDDRDSSEFKQFDRNTIVYVPCNRAAKYRNRWGYFTNFTEIPYYVNVYSENESYGRVTVSDTQTCDDRVAVFTAYPEEGYSFLRWSNGSTDNPYIYNQDGVSESVLIAYFKSDNDDVPVIEPIKLVTFHTVIGGIVVENCEGKALTMADLNGRVIYRGKASSSSHLIPVSHAGVYLVRADDSAWTKCVVLR